MATDTATVRTGVRPASAELDVLRRLPGASRPPPGHLVVPTGEAAVLPWMHDRRGQPAARAAAARHSAGLGARLPVRRVRTRGPAFRIRTGIARAAESPRSARSP